MAAGRKEVDLPAVGADRAAQPLAINCRTVQSASGPIAPVGAPAAHRRRRFALRHRRERHYSCHIDVSAFPESDATPRTAAVDA